MFFKDNLVLTISEKDQKAYLPYHFSDVQKIYENNVGMYYSLENVIDSLYVIPLDRFKNSSFSRFREAYQLIRYKEHGSVIKALDLGVELMFNYDLNPIIISACRNLDELNIYLDCLAEKQLSSFDCFEIKFEVVPQVSDMKKSEFYY